MRCGMGKYVLVQENVPQNGINRIYQDAETGVMIIDAIRGFCWEREQMEVLLHTFEKKILLIVSRLTDCVHVWCMSRAEQIRALEFLDALFADYGMLRGDAVYAEGEMSQVILDVSMTEQGTTDLLSYFMEQTDAYFSKTAVIYADKEAAREEQIRQLPIYCKKQVPWAVVETLDIAKPGEKICIKTLENDTGLIIHADADLLIMIGCLGEVYEITRQKFENSYEKSDEQLDIFSQLLDFIPAVELPRTGEYKTIDELAYLCVPKPGGIYAKQLQIRTKVFGKGRGDYFIGKAGDYLAIRLDDLQDMYIIRRENNMATYLIDYENTGVKGLVGIEQLKEDDLIIIFYGPKTGAVPFDEHVKICQAASQVKYIKTTKTAKNYLDFQLTTYLGYLVGQTDVKEYYVISKDSGYDSVIDFGKSGASALSGKKISQDRK